MELNHFRLTFDNGQEFLVGTEVSTEKEFLDVATQKGFFGSSEFISLQLSKESEPILLKSSKLFSIQRIRQGSIGAQSKIWKVA